MISIEGATIRYLGVVLASAWLILASHAVARTLDCAAAAAIAEGENALPTGLLASIGLVESGDRPFAIDADGRSSLPATADDAVRQVQRALADRARVRRCCGIALACQLLVLIVMICGTHGLIVRTTRPTTTDFVSFYAAGRLAVAGIPQETYDPVAHFEAEQQATAKGIDYVHFFYPPVFLVVCDLVARLPYLLAFVSFEGLSLALLLWALRETLDREPSSLLVVVSFSPLLWSIGVGQNSCLSAALFASGLLLLRRGREVAGGAVLGCLVLKPHLVLLPIALLAGRRWRAIGGAAAGVTGAVGLSLSLFGAGCWRAFATTLMQASGAFAHGQVVPFTALASSYGAARLVGLGRIDALVFEGAVDALVVATLWHAWRPANGVDADLRNALLVSGALLVMPVVLFYDTTLLVVAGAFLRRARPQLAGWQSVGMAAAWVLGLVAYPATRITHCPVAFGMGVLCFATTALPLFGTRIHRPLMLTS